MSDNEDYTTFLTKRAEQIIKAWEFSPPSAGGSFSKFVEACLEQNMLEALGARINMYVDKYIDDMLSIEQIETCANRALKAWLEDESVQVKGPPTSKTRRAIERVLNGVVADSAVMAKASDRMLATVYKLESFGVPHERIAMEVGIPVKDVRGAVRMAQQRAKQAHEAAAMFAKL